MIFKFTFDITWKLLLARKIIVNCLYCSFPTFTVSILYKIKLRSFGYLLEIKNRLVTRFQEFLIAWEVG